MGLSVCFPEHRDSARFVAEAGANLKEPDHLATTINGWGDRPRHELKREG
jgi:hypothetical protein